MRFAKTDYYSSKARFDYAEDKFDMSDVDGYVAQEYIFLDFDILSLEYTSEDGFTKTVIGVVADSIDIINGLTAPEDILEEEQEWWQKIMAVLLFIVFLVFFWPLLSPLVTLLFVLLWDGVKFLIRFLIKGILWVITLPFRIIGWFLK